jgi:hypothetical protein
MIGGLATTAHHKDEPTDKKPDVEEPDIPFAEALSIPPQNVSVAQAAPPAPTAPTAPTQSTTTAVPTGAAPSGGVYHIPNLGRQPKSLKCPNCQQDTQTDVTNQVDAFTFVFCVIIFLLFWPLFWLVGGIERFVSFLWRCHYVSRVVLVVYAALCSSSLQSSRSRLSQVPQATGKDPHLLWLSSRMLLQSRHWSRIRLFIIKKDMCFHPFSI